MARATKPVSSTSFYVLLALTDADRYGLEIIDDIRRRTDGRVELGPGSLYNTIKRLLAEGSIAEVDSDRGTDPRRRYYRITPAGRRRVASEAEIFETLVRAARDKNLLPEAGG